MSSGTRHPLIAPIPITCHSMSYIPRRTTLGFRLALLIQSSRYQLTNPRFRYVNRFLIPSYSMRSMRE